MFEYDGGLYTEQELKAEANKQGMDIQDLMKKLYDNGMIQVGNNSESQGLNLDMSSQQTFEQEDIEVRKRQNKTDQAVKAGLTKAYSDVLGIPEFMVPAVSGASAFLTGLVGNTANLIEKGYESSIQGMSKEEMIKDGQNDLSRSLGEMTNFLNMMGVEKYDELTGETEDLYGLFKDGRYGDAGELLAFQALSSAPALAITAAAPILGSMVLGASTAGESFEESLKNRPDQTLENIWYNSLSKGAAEWGTEWAGGKLFRVINNLDPSKKISKNVGDLAMSFGNNVLKKAGLGFLSEGITEGSTDFLQQKADQLIFGDIKTNQDFIRGFINTFAVGAVMGGGVSGGSRAMQGSNKNKLYHLISPKQWQIEQQKIARQIDNNAKDLKIAKENNDQEQVDVFQNNENKLIELANKNKTDLYSKFDAMSRTEQIKYAEQMDVANKALSVVNNKKYSEQAQAQAENVSRKAFQNMFDSIGNVDLDVDVEQSIGEALKASEILDPILKKAKGINREDLTIKILNTQEEVDAVAEKEGGGIKKSDGAFIAKGKDGKATIYINKNVAAAAGATNVLGHELLHYMISRKFKTDNKSMAPLVDELKTYLKDNHTDVFVRVQQRIDNFYTNKDGTIKDGALEEYLTVFSDLISKQKIDIKEVNSKGLTGQLTDVMAGFGFGEIKLDSAKDVISFLSTYNKNINRKGLLGKLMGTKILDVGLTSKKLVEGEGVVDKESVSKDQTDSVNELAEMGWTDKTWKESGADFAIKEMQSNKMLDGLIRSKYKADVVPSNFVDLVYSELVNHVKNFKPESNDSLFGWVNSQIANKAGNVYNREFKVSDEMKGAKDIGKTTKEGEVKVQVAAEKSSEMEAFEEEDLSIQGQAKKAKADKQKYSEYRKKLGFKEGDKIYNEVLENVKKSLMIAYGTTQNITDVQLRAQAIAAKLKKEYANLNSPLFKQIKNFLTYGIADTKVPYGTKDIYISQLKKLREDIVKNTSTADLVQMERNTPEADRVFTDFVKVLTSIDQVRDAVNKEQLPPDALNKITKDKKTGKGAFSPSLYNKVMPTETELVSWADQPGKNPITGLRQGLKGTRKDGLAMRMVNSLVTDAIMEARQSDQVQERIAGMDIDPGSVAELGAAVGREVNVKFSKSNAIEDISAAMNSTGSVNVYSQIKFSKSHREAYEKQLTKRRPDLTEEQRKGAVQSVFDFVDGEAIPNHLKSKYEKMAMHYTANGYLILPEDGYKVIEAERLATIKKLDPFSFKNPNVLIEKYVDQVKGTRTNPDNVKTFTNKTQLTNGVTVYDVEDSKQGQIDSRKVIDTHFGKKANPWCLLANDSGGYYTSDQALSLKEAKEKVKEQEAVGRTATIEGPFISEGVKEWEITIMKKVDPNDKLKGAFEMWKSYNRGGNGFKIAFQNGKLIAFRDGSKLKQWWDRMDQSSKGIVVKGKKAADGFTPTIELDGSKETITGYEKGTPAWQQENGSYIRKDFDGNLVQSHTKVNGKFIGERISPGSEGSVTIDTFKDGKIIKRVEDSTKEMQLFKNGYDVGIGADKITVYNLTKFEGTTTGDDVSLMDGQDKKVEVIEGTVMEMSENNIKLKTSPKLYDKYRGMQGEKVRIVKTRIGPHTGNHLDFSSVTINGVEQDIRVQFSKSAENNVKFSLTSKQQDRNVLPAILKKQLDVERIITEEGATESDLILLEYLNEFETAITSGFHYKEAYNSFINNLSEAAKTSLVNFKDIQLFEKSVVDTQVPQIRSLGLDAAGVYFKNKFNKLTTTKDKVDLVNKFLTNIGVSARGGKGLVKSYTNQQLLEGPVTKIFGKKFVEKHFNLAEVEKGKTIKYRYDNKAYEPVPLYRDIDIIKESRGETSIVKQVNDEAVQARAFVQEIIDSNISVSEKLAIIDLLSLNQRGAIRKMYTFGETVTSKVKKPATELVLEHEITVKNMTKYLRQRVKDILNQTQLEEIMDQAKVHVWNNNIDTILNDQGLRQEGGRKRYQNKKVKNYLQTQKDKGLITDIPSTIKPVNNLSKAVQFSRSANNPTKGITVLDFDDTLATSKSLIRFTRPDGTKGTLNAEQYASTYENLSELGYKFDFSEFTKVVDGKTAPLFNKAMKLQGKFGPKNMFVLTARPMESAAAIHAFLKANGLNIPLKNITGLANSTAESKALWMAEKVGEGYNDFYFADDALQNVKAVKNMLDQLDVKSKVQQARVKFSKSMDPAFNEILERTTGVPAEQVISQARATKRGSKKGRLELFVPPSAEDFLGLLYKFAGKGEQGNADLAFFKQSLIDPLNRAYTELNETKQAIADDYRNLKKLDPETAKKLRKQSPDADFTYGDAVRVYLWNKSGIEVPGLSETDQNTLTEMVTSDLKLQQFADQLGLISRQEAGYVAPGEYWQVGDIRNDLDDATSKIGRKQFFTEFIENSEIIFSQENLQKIEAIYGSNFREALENILYRTKTGSNKSTGSTRLESGFIKWINGSVAATMFVNTRSALLQTLSSVNFTNWGDNNPYKMAKAFANQKQFWSDFSMLFNSAKLKQRRSGLGMDINANELTTYMAKSKSSPKALLNWLLQKGFLPTQMADSFAISIGGASFYRNRVNTYLKQGMDAKQAEEKAFQDFSEIAEATQQSARPDMVSQQQASPLGKFILNFQNTPMQYTRLIKKATIDLIKGRGDIKTNISRIVYYGAVQNMIFYGLQTALFAMMFSDDEEDEEFFQKKKERVANGMVDSLLRGTGIGGAAIATAKNMIIKFLEQKEKGYNKDESAVLVQFLNFSPVVGIKAQKIVSATKGYNYNEKVIDHMSTFDINNPVWSSVSSVVEGTTNIPLNRLHKKVSNVRAGLDAENEAWQRLSVLLGFSTWDVGIENREIDAIKEELKEINKNKKKKKSNSSVKQRKVKQRKVK